TEKRIKYVGISTCLACNSLCGGDGSCVYGCTGYGDCVKSCKFDAITIKNGTAFVECSKCIGCGACVKACPKHLISLIYLDNIAKIACKNCDRGAETRKICSSGCIACGKCAKICPNEAITIIENHAVVDIDKCSGCGKCKTECPLGIIL
ncbi:MAG: 4Fe-4S binding protein, partial [Clostridia bacterium]